MRTDEVARNLVSGLDDVAEKARNFSERVKDRWEDTRHDLNRGVHRAKEAVEDRIDDVRHEIKTHPFSAVMMTAAGAFLLGGLVGWLTGRRRS